MSATTTPICPCDADEPAPPTNLPGLSSIAYRNGTFREFRRALLTPLQPPPGGAPVEAALSGWRSGIGADPTVPDLGVMMVEWWAYLADILTFYNERIANEDYLRTVQQPESAGRLVSLLGYRPRPALGAAGTLAALVTPGQIATLPQGLQFQSKPGPGQEPQIFELAQPTTIAAPDVVAATTPPFLVAETGTTISISVGSGSGFSFGNIFSSGAFFAVEDAFAASSAASKFEVESHFSLSTSFSTTTASSQFSVYRPPQYYRGIRTPWWPPPQPIVRAVNEILVQGTVTTVSAGALLLLGTRDDTVSPTLIALSNAPVPQTVPGGKQTALNFTVAGGTALSSSMTASNARLQRAGQSIALWSINSGTVGPTGTVIQLASLARQIRANDWVVFSAPGVAQPQLVQVLSSQDMLGDASKGSGASATSVSAGGTDSHGNPLPTPIPVLHTQLTLATALDADLQDNVAAISVLFGWIEVGTLLNQPPPSWDATSPSLIAIQPASFANGVNAPIIIQDSTGAAVIATGTSGGDGNLSVGLSTPQPPLVPPMQPPFQVFYNLLAVTRGKTIANETLGSGDATIAGQSFQLANAPVTYFAKGTGFVSTIVLRVNGVPWTEVANFYGQGPKAQVFITREDAQGNTHVEFGDGVNGARLPSGTNNVVATYRIGAGAASPPAGKLTSISQAWPGLRAVQNPIAVSGGNDADPPALLQQAAPRSVLTFGRAVSIDDYQAVAMLAAGVTRAAAVWTWNAANQRAGVIVFVAGSGDVASTAGAMLASAGDPNRPVQVVAATPLLVTLVLTLVVTPGYDTNAITAGVIAALADPATGLFSAALLGIGQTVFDSQIEAACIGVSGVVAVSSSTLYVGQSIDPGPLHAPGEGAFYLLTPDGVYPTTQADPNG